MVELNEINPQFLKALQEAGWTSTRKIETTAWMAILEGEGYKPSSMAKIILESFGNLRVNLPKSVTQPYDQLLWFEPVEAAAGLYLAARHFEDQLGIFLFPLGAIDIDTVLWVGSDGNYYIGLMYGLYLLGRTIREVTNQLGCPNDQLLLCADTKAD